MLTFEDHDTKLVPRKMQKSEVDFLVLGQPAQSALEYATKSDDEPTCN
jgi:hypothetical protein